MMTAEELVRINAAMENWRQGDFFLSENLFFIHLADLAQPLTPEADEVASERVATGDALEVEGVASAVVGYVVITQTCDIVRNCKSRAYVELCPLVEVTPAIVKEVRLLRRPAFAFVPRASDKNLVADLDRIITVEKAFLSNFDCTAGCKDDSERRAFADALGRHRIRPAFPDDFNNCMSPLRDHLKKIHRGTDPEGLLIQSVGEIRVSVSPNWDAEQIAVFLWFILSPASASPSTDISSYINKWLSLFEASKRYEIQAVVCRLEDMKASDYVGSDRLDLDQLSVR